MSNLSPPPSREKLPVSNGYAEMPWAWLKWFSDIKELLAPVATSGLFPWSSVSKTGSNLTDLETRNHADLQNINTATYTHLTATNHTDLTDGGETALHGHKWPMVADTIDVSETVTVAVNRQLIVAAKLTNNGTLTNNGRVHIL